MSEILILRILPYQFRSRAAFSLQRSAPARYSWLAASHPGQSIPGTFKKKLEGHLLTANKRDILRSGPLLDVSTR